MGNGVGKLGGGKLGACFSGEVEGRHSPYISVLLSDPLDEGLGHSFCYVRPDPSLLCSYKVHSEETTTFSAISGASVSANTSTPLSTSILDLYSNDTIDRAAAFESSTSFASIPLQPIPRNSGPIYGNSYYGGTGIHCSGPLERGFLSGPIERGFMSGPLDRGIFSGPLEKASSIEFERSFSHAGFASRSRSKASRLIRILRRALSKTVTRGRNSIVAPIKAMKEPDWILGSEKYNDNLTVSCVNLSSDGSLEDDYSKESQNLQWAQGKAGEDRVHVVVSEEHGWVFVGIYDGFNGPDAPDYLLSNLYSAVHQELKGLLWDEKSEPSGMAVPIISPLPSENSHSEMADSKPGNSEDFVRNQAAEACSQCFEPENSHCPSGTGNFDSNSRRRKGRNSKGKYRGAMNKWEDNQRRWKCEWDRERQELDRRLKEQLNRSHSDGTSSVDHADVLKALSQALRKTEEAFLDNADKMLVESPVLALMGSCLLVMLMKGDDVYVMNVGDSRAVLAQKKPDYWLGKISNDLEKINEETTNDLEGVDSYQTCIVCNLSALQLSTDHSTSEEEEVLRIKNEHPDDVCAVTNDRVKGSLKVTRAFGAGFLKQPKWNNALLEMFRVDFVGTSPYITCSPSLYHHRLGSKDRFVILSSDGLYQYFTNEEAVSEVELFVQLQPEGDPAQHLVEEVLFRAARKAGMDFHELLEIPVGDRRKYHDDVSIIVISLEGRIWRSCV